MNSLERIKLVSEVIHKSRQSRETTMTRAETIKAILEAEKAERWSLIKTAQRCTIIGTNGKEYGSVFGLPLGVSVASKGREYWVLESKRDGTTYGVQHPTEEALLDTVRKGIESRSNDFKEQLEAMDDEQIASQASYWLK